MEEIIYKYFPELTELQKDKFAQLYELYEDWNAKINTLSRKDFPNFYIHHVLHSLSIAKFVKFKRGTKIIDLGTGGGFPTIPLAIMFPDVDFTAVDSIKKKIKVVTDVAEILDLNNVLGIWSRVENLNEEVDFVITRAVAPLEKLVYWSKPFIHQISFNDKKNGLIALKGGDLKEEIRESKKKKVKVKSISDYFEEEFFVTKKIVYLPL